ncbi:hypothetical protein [Microbacterium sp. SORGH_AS_0888]|uniref:hypothetical protein n=1 Tax=Microbacterium sp. SORGH_AS_0888 TaxID=3041791 RepID=UPI00277DBC40|nr:hypothetical protein [Microbacterium sp. SORGH_AS_0888]MDQ1129758.1 hypothetical protein [Microbacterium sp. SORGH_AS_0888]
MTYADLVLREVLRSIGDDSAWEPFAGDHDLLGSIHPITIDGAVSAVDVHTSSPQTFAPPLPGAVTVYLVEGRLEIIHDDRAENLVPGDVACVRAAGAVLRTGAGSTKVLVLAAPRLP